MKFDIVTQWVVASYEVPLDKSLASRSIVASEGQLREESPKPDGARMQAV